MLPTTVIDYRIDYRYFIMASGKTSTDLIGKKEGGTIFIDDLIPPARKHYSIENYFKKLKKIHKEINIDDSQMSGRIRSGINELKGFYSQYKSRKFPAFHLLQEFEDILGVREGVKAFWGLAVCHTSSHAKELHEVLRRSLLKMTFKNIDCVLNYSPDQRANDERELKPKFGVVYKILIKKILMFLKSKKNELPTLDERQLNQVISKFYDIDISDMLQGWKLKNYVSPESREHILKTFMCSENEIEANFVSLLIKILG